MLTDPHKNNGFTLIEVLITIVVLSIAGTAIMGVFINTVQTSANPLIQQQAVSIAEAYMEEIVSKRFTEPDGVETGGAEAGESRSTYDDVSDFNDSSVDGGVKDQNGTAIAGLGGYTVAVEVTAAALGFITQASGDALKIDITVTHTAIGPIRLSGFRTNH